MRGRKSNGEQEGIYSANGCDDDSDDTCNCE